MNTEPKVETTEQRLAAILAEIDSQEEVRDEIFQRFFLTDALDLAKRLHTFSLPDKTKGAILRLKIYQPPPYEGSDLSVLLEKSMQNLWKRIAESAV